VKLIDWTLAFMLIFGVFYGYADISKVDAEISTLNRILEEQQAEKHKLLKESDKLAEKITKEKRKSEGKSSRKLDSMLRESQRLVSNLESISIKIAAIEAQLKQQYSMAITALVRQLENEAEEKKKKSLLEQLFKYMEVSERLKEPLKFEMPEVNLEIQEDDTPLEIREKADFLSDQTALLKARILQIDTQIATLEKEKALRDKVKGFADEISFFDDILFVEGKKVEPVRETAEVNPTREPKIFQTGIDTEKIEPKVTQPETVVQKETLDFPLSDSVLSGESVGKQIELLTQQKLKLGEQLQQLSQKTQSFYKRAAELNQSKSNN